MNKYWLHYITPCILASVIAFIMAVAGLASIDDGECYVFVFCLCSFPPC